MNLKKLFLLSTLTCSLVSMELSAQQVIKACNGKTYQEGDTIRFGKPSFSGYLFINAVDENGNCCSVQDVIAEKEAVIKEIPAYQQDLYEQMGIFEQPETPQLVLAENESGKYYINLNAALVKGNLISAYHKSGVEGIQSTTLSPSILFVYAKKLYNTPIDQQAIDNYAELCSPEEYTAASGDPFALEELRATYKSKLEKAMEAADFNQVFRIRCLSELKQYDMEKLHFPLGRFSCIDIETKQKDELAKLGYVLWEECTFHFTNQSKFLQLPCPKERAKGFYAMRKIAKKNDYPMATTYVYVRIKNKPVTLPAQKTLVVNSKDGFDFHWSTLDKAYGKSALDMEIIQVDGFDNPVMELTEEEATYNYLGTQK